MPSRLQNYATYTTLNRVLVPGAFLARLLAVNIRRKVNPHVAILKKWFFKTPRANVTSISTSELRRGYCELDPLWL